MSPRAHDANILMSCVLFDATRAVVRGYLYRRLLRDAQRCAASFPARCRLSSSRYARARGVPIEVRDRLNGILSDALLLPSSS